jgi:hypothetical protein
VCNVNGMIMKRKDRSNRRKTIPSATLSTKNSHMVWPRFYHIWIIREMYEREIQEERVNQRVKLSHYSPGQALSVPGG